MLRDGNWVPAALYAGASLVLGIGAVWPRRQQPSEAYERL